MHVAALCTIILCIDAETDFSTIFYKYTFIFDKKIAVCKYFDFLRVNRFEYNLGTIMIRLRGIQHPKRRNPLKKEETVRQLAIAIYTVNRHAKTATNNRELYSLKNKAIQQLLQSGDAKKIGLHFVDNPQLSSRVPLCS